MRLLTPLILVLLAAMFGVDGAIAAEDSDAPGNPHASKPGEQWQFPWPQGEVLIGPAGCSGPGCETFCRSTQAWTACSSDGYSERRRVASSIFAESDEYRDCVSKKLGREEFAKLRMARLLNLESASKSMMACGFYGRGSSVGRVRLAGYLVAASQELKRSPRATKRCVMNHLGRPDFERLLDEKLVDGAKVLAAMKSCSSWTPPTATADEPVGKHSFSNDPWKSAPPGCKDIASCEVVCTDPDNFEKCLAWPYLPASQRTRIEGLKRQTEGSD